MSVYKTIEVNKSRFLAVWHIEETFEEMLESLNPRGDDHTLLHSFKNSRKQLEWLAGRLTLKHLVSTLGLNYHGIDKDSHGKPYLRGYSHEISLTHSHPYVAAIIDTSEPVGVDLEQPREKITRIAPKFLSDKELTFAQNDIQKLNMMWCIKETLYKIHGRNGLIFKDELDIEPFDINTDKTITGNIIVNSTVKSYKIGYIVTKNYILTYNL